MKRLRLVLLASLLFQLTLLSALLFAAPPPVRAATIINVNTATDELNNDGDCSLREAIIAANSDAAVDTCPAGSGADTVNVPAGNYVLTLAGSGEDAAATGDLDLHQDVTLVGAGSALTIIDGNAQDRIWDVAPAGFGDPVPEIEVHISDMTVRNGHATSGGAIRYASTLTVSNSIIRDSTSDVNGGGLAATDQLFDAPHLTLTDSVVTQNTAPFLGGDGGGIDASFSVGLIVTRSHIVDNSSATGGGIAAFVISERPILDQVIVEGNSAGPGLLGIGGGLAGPAWQITNSSIINNTSSANGGGIQFSFDTEITNTTFSGNTADRGGAIGNSGDGILTNVTITNNTATMDGGGILQFGAGSSTTLQNTIIANNPGGDCSALPPTSAGSNIDSDGSCNLTDPSDLPNTDPMLSALGDNGGFTPTHALMEGSPAIDMVTNPCPPPAADQRGVARPQDGNADSDAGCDTGAFELEAEVLAVQIDIKPGSDKNPVNLKSKGKIPVAILSTESFDATQVDPLTVCFGDADDASQRDCTEAHGKGHPEDVNGDGLVDLLLHFNTQETGIDAGDNHACLTGTTTDGFAIEGCDSIQTKP
jgi:CSLREA domain-containing protein